MPNNPLNRLAALGQSVWLDYIHRDLFSSGQLRTMIAQDSLSGMTSNPAIFEKAIAHSTAKAGIVAMTRQMAMEGAPHNIRANSISPGSVVSNQSKVQLADETWADYLASRIMLGRPAEPREIATAALFLASGDSSYVTGAALPVDGGLTAW